MLRQATWRRPCCNLFVPSARFTSSFTPIVTSNPFHVQMRSQKLKQLLTKFEVYTFFEPAHLLKVGPSSTPALITREGYRSVMREANKMKQYDLVVELHKECELSNLGLEPRILVQLFEALRRLQDKDLLYDNIEKVKQCGQFDARVHQAIVSALCDCGDLENAFDLIRYIQNTEENPKEEPYLTYLYNDTIAASDMRRGKDLFMFLRNRKPFAPNPDSYNNLIQKYGIYGKFKSAQMVFKQLERDDVSPTRRTFEIMASMVSHSQDPKAIDYVVESMKKYNMQPNAAIIERIVFGYSNCGEIMKARKVFYDTMKFQYEQTGNIMRMITSATYLALLHGYLLIENIDECEELITEMRSAKMEDQLDIVYTRSISLCCSRDPLRAHALFMKMKEDAINPIVENYNDMICALCGDPNRIIYIDKVEHMFAETEEVCFVLDPRTYHRMLDLFMDDGKWDHVFSLIRSMINNNMVVPRKAYERVLKQGSERMDEHLLEDLKSSYSL